MADWATISALATAGGTVALGAATYASVRSVNRAARTAELALQEQRRPVLVHSRTDDRVEPVRFIGGHLVSLPGGGAAVDAVDNAVHLALSLRNVGSGIAVMQRWQPYDRLLTGDTGQPDAQDFRPLSRDQYVPSGDVGIWQAALRHPDDPPHAALSAFASDRTPFSLDLLYTDQVGGQRTISRFGLLPERDERWQCADELQAGPEVPFEAQLETMIQLRDEGNIGGVGLSNVTLEQLRTGLARTDIACVQNPFSLVQRDDEATLEACRQAGIPYVPFFPLGSAFPRMPKVTEQAAVREVADRLGATPAQVGLAWLLHHSPNILLIPGTSSLAHLEENVAAAEVELDAEAMARLEQG